MESGSSSEMQATNSAATDGGSSGGDGGLVARSASRGRVFLAFLRLGLTAFGGPAIIAYMRDLAVKKHRWLSQESFEDGVALCQSIPGATAMQTSAYIGFRAAGALGALAAYVGFGLPAFVLMVAFGAAYQAGVKFALVLSVFHGLHVIVIAIIVNAAVNFARTSVKNWRDAILAAGAAVVLVLHGSPIIVIAASAAVSILLYRGVAFPNKPTHAPADGQARRSLRFAAMLSALAVAGTVVLYMTNRPLFDLGTLMLKVDAFAFGGGFASVPLMMHEVVEVRHWLDARTFMDGIALGQVTPGPIVITATFVGYQVGGLLGAVVGTIGIFTPSFLMVLVTVPFFDRLQHSMLFRKALRGVLASFVGLLVAVSINFGAAVAWTIPAVLLGAAAVTALRLKVDILWVVLAGAAISMLVM